ncbi:hypothetical protein WJX72_011844 [[Myrmecia] bisecta]|uniref:Uncharacterized protein n=1 Tax=[Myrmecia] bisecta TaxID=41462 RepID=A0AAW1P3Y8_9CHLO
MRPCRVLWLLALSLALVTPFASAAAVHGEVANLPQSCQAQLNSIYDEYYSLTTNKAADFGDFNCVGDCRLICKQTIQQALDGRDTVDCPAEYDVQACMNLAQDDWLELAQNCALFSSPFVSGASAPSPAAEGRRLLQEGEGVEGAAASDTRTYTGVGCFPTFTNVTEFKQWMEGTFVDTSAPAPSTGTSPATSGSANQAIHGEVATLPQSCQATLNSIYSEYYAANVTKAPDFGTFQCTGSCRTNCQATVEAALAGKDSTKCPSEADIQKCMNLAQDDWLKLADDCALFSSPFNTAGKVQGEGAEGEGRRRLLDEGEAAEGVVDVNARTYMGNGCFPALLDVTELKSWLEGTYKPTGPGKINPVAVIFPVLFAIGIGSMAFF